jgi:hypothetical protein
VGERNCPAFALPGVETESANAAAPPPPRHGSYTRKTTVSLPFAALVRLAAFAHDGTLPDNAVRKGAAANRGMNAMPMIVTTAHAKNDLPMTAFIVPAFFRTSLCSFRDDSRNASTAAKKSWRVPVAIVKSRGSRRSLIET